MSKILNAEEYTAKNAKADIMYKVAEAHATLTRCLRDMDLNDEHSMKVARIAQYDVALRRYLECVNDAGIGADMDVSELLFNQGMLINAYLEEEEQCQ